MFRHVRDMLGTPTAITAMIALFVVAAGIIGKYGLPTKLLSPTKSGEDIAALPGTGHENPFVTGTLSLGNASGTDMSEDKQNFYKDYLSQAIQDVRASTTRDIVAKFDTKQLADRYAISDLNVSADTSPDALRAYANDFGKIVRTYKNAEKDMQNETSVISNALKTKKSSDLAPLEIPATAYEKFSEDLRKLKTPTNCVEFQLLIVNAYDVMGRALFVTERILQDPVAGAAGWQTYIAKIPNVNRGYAGIINVMHDKGVTFTKDESGYYFRWVTVTPKTNTASTKKKRTS